MSYYLRNCYINNLLREPGRLTMCGVPIDLGTVAMPTYILATREDHIVPWRSAYRSVQLLGGDAEFVLGGSGHIAGVINPASKNRREFWIDGVQGADADEWLASAEERKGSWWPHWRAWLGRHAGTSARRRPRRAITTIRRSMRLPAVMCWKRPEQGGGVAHVIYRRQFD